MACVISRKTVVGFEIGFDWVYIPAGAGPLIFIILC
jgi:hypothetical protein